MKRCLLLAGFSLCAGLSVNAQITITSADMPVLGDTLRYSTALPSANLGLTNTGASATWNYSSLTPTIQTVDTYRTASAAGYTGGGIPGTAYGYKIADSFPGAPVPVKDIYTFFSVKPGTSSPNRFVAEGFGAKLAGAIAIPGGYSNEDTIYNFPLTFGRSDNSTFRLVVNVALLGASLKQQGQRQTVVDGWGTLTTPFVSGVQALRVRSEVTEMDTIVYNGNTIPLPRHTVEYKWLANGQRGPLLQITTAIVGTTETPTSVRYRDTKRSGLGVTGQAQTIEQLVVYPNPASGSQITVKMPASWSAYRVHVYDATGKLISEAANKATINTVAFPSGHYTIVVENNGQFGMAQFVK